MGLKPADTNIIWVAINGTRRNDSLPDWPMPWFGSVICRRIDTNVWKYQDLNKRCTVDTHGYYITITADVWYAKFNAWFRFFLTESNFYLPLVPGADDSDIQDTSEPYYGGTAAWWFGNTAGTDGSADDIRAALGIPADGKTFFEVSGSVGLPSVRLARKDKSGTVYIKTKGVV